MAVRAEQRNHPPVSPTLGKVLPSPGESDSTFTPARRAEEEKERAARRVDEVRELSRLRERDMSNY